MKAVIPKAALQTDGLASILNLLHEVLPAFHDSIQRASSGIATGMLVEWIGGLSHPKVALSIQWLILCIYLWGINWMPIEQPIRFVAL